MAKVPNQLRAAVSAVLAQFVTICCHRDISPADVSDLVQADLQSQLDGWLLGKDPSKLCEEKAQTWNRILKSSGLSLNCLTYAKRFFSTPQ